MDRPDNAEVIKCPGCGAEYDSIPSITCPRCRSVLCNTGCDGCKAPCALIQQRSKMQK